MGRGLPSDQPIGKLANERRQWRRSFLLSYIIAHYIAIAVT